MNIVILLSTYNGQKYIDELLQSILNQSFMNWTLVIRDDGSNDGTTNIIMRYCEQDARIQILSDNIGNVGVVKSFSILAEFALDHYYSEFVMFADQDDIWHSDKIDLTLSEMNRLVSECPDKTPLAVHTDLRVVQQSGEVISRSFMKLQGLRHENNDPVGVLLIQNYVTGCTLMVNRDLLKLALPIPSVVMMHDWWMALCAAVFGEIGFVNKPTIDYRQHEHNTIGAKSIFNTILTRLSMSKRERRAIEEHSWMSLIGQANELLNILDSRKAISHDKARLQLFAALPDVNQFYRIVIMSRMHIRRQNLILNIIFYVRLPFLRLKHTPSIRS
jgi:rhamnosyltransferase